jgi:hypothetical protein
VAVVYPDHLLEGPTLDDLTAGLGGETWNVVLLDAGGVALGVAGGRFHRYGEGDGGVIVYPEPGDEVAAVHVPGVGTLTLTSP